MTSISNALFWISNGLLVPVVVLLLFFFLRAILMIGGFFGEFWQKAKLQQQMNDILEKLTPENTEEFYKQLPADKNIPMTTERTMLTANACLPITKSTQKRIWDVPALLSN